MGYNGDDFGETIEFSFGFPLSSPSFNDGFELENNSGVILLESGSYLLQET